MQRQLELWRRELETVADQREIWVLQGKCQGIKKSLKYVRDLMEEKPKEVVGG